VADHRDRIAGILVWCAVLVPALVALRFVLRYAVNLPYADQWDFVAFFVVQDAGQLRWSDIWALHNEHRMVVPKLLMLGMARLTRWNVFVETLLSVALAFASLLLLLAMARPALREAHPWARLWAVAMLSLLVFSLSQVGNWLWGWQIQWFLSVLAAIVAIALATAGLQSASASRYVIGAGVAALVCQYSLASGAVVWALVAAILAFHRRRGPILAVWAVAAVAATVPYAIGFERPADLPSPLAVLGQPLALAIYVGKYLSGPLGRHTAIGMGAVAVFFVLIAAAARRHRDRPALVLPWVMLGLFAMANAVLTGLGRVGTGVDQALTTRYVTIALLLPVALVPLAFLALRDAGRSWRLAGGAGAMLLTLAVVAADIRSVPEIEEFSRRMKAGRDCVRMIETAPDSCLNLLHPNADVVRRAAPELRRLRLSLFADDG
jgi:hypothetical protein